MGDRGRGCGSQRRCDSSPCWGLFLHCLATRRTLTRTLVWNQKWGRCCVLSCLQAWDIPVSLPGMSFLFPLCHSNPCSCFENSLNVTSAWVPQNNLRPTLCWTFTHTGFCYVCLFLYILNCNFLFICLPYSILSPLKIEVISNLYFSPASNVIHGIIHSFLNFIYLFNLFIYLFIRGEGRDKERERDIDSRE